MAFSSAWGHGLILYGFPIIFFKMTLLVSFTMSKSYFIKKKSDSLYSQNLKNTKGDGFTIWFNIIKCVPVFNPFSVLLSAARLIM